MSTPTRPTRKATATPMSAIAPELRPVTALRGVGEALAEKLQKLGIVTVQDLLFLLPLRYEDRTRITPIGSLQIADRAVVEGEVQLAEVAFRGRRQLLCRIHDGSGSLTLRFFYFSSAQQQALIRGARIRCYGEIRRGLTGFEIVHPEYRRVGGDEVHAVEESLTPVYPLTEGLQQNRLRQLTTLALREVADRAMQDWLPPSIVNELQLPSLPDALRYVHRPPPDAKLELLAAGMHPAQRRLAFEELLAHQLSLRLLRREIRQDPGWAFQSSGALPSQLLSSLPFQLTGAQRRVWQEIQRDLAVPNPMLRLVQGDVGSGKTVVAALAAVSAVEAGFQAAIMAPTELLADQHARNFTNWLLPLNLEVAQFSGRRTGSARARALEDLASGKAQIAVGCGM